MFIYIDFGYLLLNVQHNSVGKWKQSIISACINDVDFVLFPMRVLISFNCAHMLPTSIKKTKSDDTARRSINKNYIKLIWLYISYTLQSFSLWYGNIFGIQLLYQWFPIDKRITLFHLFAWQKCGEIKCHDIVKSAFL